MAESSPIVTICVATHNRPQLLPQCIASIKAQTLQNFELIVVDDGSTPAVSDTIVSSLKDRAIILRNDPNIGLARSRNRGIMAAKGRYFTFIDDDDVWDPTFLDKMVSAAKLADEFTLTICGNAFQDDVGNQVESCPNFNGKLTDFIGQGYAPPVAAQLFPTDLIQRVKGYHETIKNGIDHDLWIKLLPVGPINVQSLPEPLAHHGRSLAVERLTTNIDKRISGIRFSMTLWTPILTSIYGQAFAEAFEAAYLKREYIKGLDRAIRKREFATAFQCQRQLPFSIKRWIKPVVKGLPGVKKMAPKRRVLTVQPQLSGLSGRANA